MNNISKTLSELTNSLSDESASLTQALLKTKVLLHHLGHAELTEWVNHELNGYPHSDSCPPYRLLKGEITADLTNGAWHYSAQPLPVLHLTEEQRQRFQTVHISQPVSVLEAMHANMSENTLLGANLPLELSGLLRKSIDRTYIIQRLWVEADQNAISGLLTQIRSRLLDFILSLGDKLGSDLTDKEAKAQTESMDMPGMFKHAIFGDNTTILVGQHKVQTVTNKKSIQGNLEGLAEELRQHHVSEPDIVALKNALSSDEHSPEIANKQFGPAVKDWMKLMFDKAIDATWNIELGIVSGLLTTSIQKYLGWG